MSIERKTALDAIHQMQDRQSIRNFSDKPISQEDLDEIIRAITTAASAGNLQPVSVIVERDPERCQKLGELCSKQVFIGKAPVNLIFLMDWHKLSVYAAERNAPFNCNDSWMHFITGLEDVMCAAQSAETAAGLLGIGSCYIGTAMYSGAEIAEMYELPPMVYPMIVLSMGYTIKAPPKRRKLEGQYVVFEGKYPQLEADEICRAYDKKYEGITLPFPHDEKRRQEMIEKFRRGLLTTYSPERTEEIIKEALDRGYITEVQRRFGTHYHAVDNYNRGGHILEMMMEQDIFPSRILRDGPIDL